MANSMEMSLSKFWEIVKDKEVWCAAVHGITKKHNCVTEQCQQGTMKDTPYGSRDRSKSVCVLNHSVISNSWQPQGLQHTRALCPWGFSRQEYWSGLPYLPPGDLPNPGIKPRSPILQAILYQLTHQGSPSLRIRCNNYKYSCTQDRSTSIYKTNANIYRRGNQ